MDTKYLHHILDIIQNISQGHYDSKINFNTTNPELIAIAKGVNHLSDKLEANVKSINEKNDELIIREEQLNLVLESLQTGILMIDAETRRIVACNKKAEEIIGLSRDKLIDEICHKFICPAEKDCCPVLDKGENIDNSERIIVNSKKETIPILKNVIRMNYHNRPVLLESFVDISHQKKIENQLRNSEKNFSDTIENMSKAIAVYRFDESINDFRFIGFNRYAENIETLTKDKVLNKALKELFPSVEEFGLYEVLKRVRKTGQPEHFPVSVYQDNRISGYRENYVYQLANGDIVCVYDDITETKKMEEDLILSRERFDLAVKGSSDGIWDWDLKTNELFLSPQWKMQLGYEDDELKNEFETFQSLMHPEDINIVFKHLNDYLELRTETYHIVFRMKHKDGKYHWILARAIAIRDAEGNPYRMSGSHTDITEIRRIQEELLESNRTKDRFFSIIAHDLKSPLGTLMGLSEMMVNNQTNIPEASREKILQSIYKSSKATFELLQNLLLWSRAQTGRVEYNPENLNPLEILSNSFNLMENTAKDKGIEISLEEKDSCLIYADKNMMDTVIRNLLANAIKFTPSGGKILLSVEKKEDKTDIKVLDSGIGIKEEDIPKLFKIDQSFSTKGTNQEEGTGLGLIICKEFAEKNKGELIVKSEFGKGSSFTISLPAVNE